MPGKEERIRQDNGRRRRQKRRRGGASRGGGGSTSDDDGDDEIQFKTMVDCSFCWGLVYFVSRSFGLCLVSFQVSIFLSIFKCWWIRVYQIHGRLDFFLKIVLHDIEVYSVLVFCLLKFQWAERTSPWLYMSDLNFLLRDILASGFAELYVRV